MSNMLTAEQLPPQSSRLPPKWPAFAPAVKTYNFMWIMFPAIYYLKKLGALVWWTILDKSSHNFALGPYSYLCIRKFFYVRTPIWCSCLIAYANHLSCANFDILTSSVRKIGILIFFFAYAGGRYSRALPLFHVGGKINATGGMLYIV